MQELALCRNWAAVPRHPEWFVHPADHRWCDTDERPVRLWVAYRRQRLDLWWCKGASWILQIPEFVLPYRLSRVPVLHVVFPAVLVLWRSDHQNEKIDDQEILSPPVQKPIGPSAAAFETPRRCFWSHKQRGWLLLVPPVWQPGRNLRFLLLRYKNHRISVLYWRYRNHLMSGLHS